MKRDAYLNVIDQRDIIIIVLTLIGYLDLDAFQILTIWFISIVLQIIIFSLFDLIKGNGK